MRTYKTPLKRRQKQSARVVSRYWSDPEFRLARVNYDRRRRGLSEHGSLDELARRHDKNPSHE